MTKAEETLIKMTITAIEDKGKIVAWNRTSDAIEAMKQHVLDFLCWADENGYISVGGGWYSKKGEDDVSVTELYDKFNNQ